MEVVGLSEGDYILVGNSGQQVSQVLQHTVKRNVKSASSLGDAGLRRDRARVACKSKNRNRYSQSRGRTSRHSGLISVEVDVDER